MQIMSDSHFQYRSNQNQFENDYDGRRTLSVEIKLTNLVSCIIAYFSKRKYGFCKSLDREGRDRILYFTWTTSLYELFPLL